MALWEPAARELVRDSVAVYAHADGRAPLDDLILCLTEDGVLEVKGERRAEARAAVVARLSFAGRPRVETALAGTTFFTGTSSNVCGSAPSLPSASRPRRTSWCRPRTARTTGAGTAMSSPPPRAGG